VLFNISPPFAGRFAPNRKRGPAAPYIRYNNTLRAENANKFYFILPSGLVGTADARLITRPRAFRRRPQEKFVGKNQNKYLQVVPPMVV
jgi:hypothetical protein